MGGGPDVACPYKDPALCDAGTDGSGGEEPLPDPDDAGCKLPNGGITCVSSLDCPPADACTCYRCEPFGIAGTLTCVAYSQDAGACGQ